MGCVIAVASGKGGVGKTTVSANLSAAISRNMYKVLVIDMDLGLSSLDLLLGVSNVVYNIDDVAAGRCELADAIIELEDGKLFYIAASTETGYRSFDSAAFVKKINAIRNDYDFIILDAPAGIGFGFETVVSVSDKLYLVATPDVCTARDCERALRFSSKYYLKEQRLILNRVNYKNVKENISLNIDDMIDTSGVRLIGAIPEDRQIAVSASKYTLCIDDKKSKAGMAIKRIAERAAGKKIPLKKFW